MSVTTSRESLQSFSGLSDIPTIAESGVPDYQSAGWVMIVAPANVARAIVNRLHAKFKGIVALPDIQAQFVKLGTIPFESPSPEEQQRFINSEIVRWAKVVLKAGIAGSE